MNRKDREKKTIAIMIEMYCGHLHSVNGALCTDCKKILEYALEKLEDCPIKDEKPVCNKCTVHCYSQKERKKVKEIMRFSGPRMLRKHPYLSIMHLIDSNLRK